MDMALRAISFKDGRFTTTDKGIREALRGFQPGASPMMTLLTGYLKQYTVIPRKKGKRTMFMLAGRMYQRSVGYDDFEVRGDDDRFYLCNNPVAHKFKWR
jgi:hypothetical protein